MLPRRRSAPSRPCSCLPKQSSPSIWRRRRPRRAGQKTSDLRLVLQLDLFTGCFVIFLSLWINFQFDPVKSYAPLPPPHSCVCFFNSLAATCCKGKPPSAIPATARRSEQHSTSQFHFYPYLFILFRLSFWFTRHCFTYATVSAVFLSELLEDMTHWHNLLKFENSQEVSADSCTSRSVHF